MDNVYREMVNIVAGIGKGTLKENYFTDIIVGTVSQSNPIQIKISSSDGKSIFTLDDTNIFLSPFCKKMVVKHTHTHTIAHTHQYYDSDTGEGASGSQTRTTENPSVEKTGNEVPNPYTYMTDVIPNPPEIILWDDLQIGESVLLLRCGKGQKYYCLQRVEKNGG